MKKGLILLLGLASCKMAFAQDMIVYQLAEQPMTVQSSSPREMNYRPLNKQPALSTISKKSELLQKLRQAMHKPSFQKPILKGKSLKKQLRLGKNKKRTNSRVERV
jgi:hypothetical protein